MENCSNKCVFRTKYASPQGLTLVCTVVVSVCPAWTITVFPVHNLFPEKTCLAFWPAGTAIICCLSTSGSDATHITFMAKTKKIFILIFCTENNHPK